jgi:hypothetical protein
MARDPQRSSLARVVVSLNLGSRQLGVRHRTA